MLHGFLLYCKRFFAKKKPLAKKTTRKAPKKAQGLLFVLKCIKLINSEIAGFFLEKIAGKIQNTKGKTIDYRLFIHSLYSLQVLALEPKGRTCLFLAVCSVYVSGANVFLFYPGYLQQDVAPKCRSWLTRMLRGDQRIRTGKKWRMSLLYYNQILSLSHLFTIVTVLGCLNNFQAEGTDLIRRRSEEGSTQGKGNQRKG